MFERYTEKARRAIFFARYEASQFGSPSIETEHLLLGLLREDKPLTNRLFKPRATVESLAYQTRDVVDTMVAESDKPLKTLRADGGASQNDFLMQFQADLLDAAVDRPKIVETTATGAAFLAGLGVGFWKSTAELEHIRKVDRIFRPHGRRDDRESHYAGWKRAVAMVRTQ